MLPRGTRRLRRRSLGTHRGEAFGSLSSCSLLIPLSRPCLRRRLATSKSGDLLCTSRRWILPSLSIEGRSRFGLWCRLRCSRLCPCWVSRSSIESIRVFFWRRRSAGPIQYFCSSGIIFFLFHRIAQYFVRCLYSLELVYEFDFVASISIRVV